MKRLLTVIVALLLSTPVFLRAGYLHSHLVKTLNNKKADDIVKVIVHVKGYPDFSSFKENDYAGKRDYLKEYTRLSQQPIIDYIKKIYPGAKIVKQYWVFNGFVAELPKWVIEDVVQRDDIDYIVDDYRVQLVHPENYTKTAYPSGSEEVPWDRKLMNAHKAWKMGYTGKGVVLGIMDTGSDVKHPCLKNKWRGIQAWDDEAYGMSEPEDHEGHGTSCSSIMVGDYNLGIAPGAKYIVVAILDSSGGGSLSNIHNGFSWIANLPDSLKPRVVSNSWGMDDWDNTEFWTDCLTWRNIGILPVFAAGNNSVAPDSQDTPGTFPTVLSVGATDKYDNILSYSGRGGAPQKSPWDSTGAWYTSDWNFHKPDVSAPADPVLAAYPGGDYINDFNGTSSATPHVAGLAALILQKNPDLTLSQLYKIIRDNTYKTMADTHDYPNDTFGWGRVDAYRALMNTPEPNTPNIFIDTVLIGDRNGDGDGFLDPGESDIDLVVRLTNWGTHASGVQPTITYTSSSYLTINSTPGPIRDMYKYDTLDATFNVSLGSSQPESSFIYFTLKITDDQGQTFYKFFNVFVPMQDKPSKTDTLVNDDGSASYNTSNDNHYANWDYFAERFEVAAPCSLKAIQLYWDGTATAETLFVWHHNADNDAPDSTIWGWSLIDVNTADAWTTVTLSNPIYIGQAGYFWVGVRKSSSTAVPWQDDDAAPDGVNLSTTNRNDPSSWDDRNWWYTFMMRPIVKTEAITAPKITEVSSYRIDDSEYGDDNGRIDPDEKVGLYVALKNIGTAAFNATGILRCADQTTKDRIRIIDSTAYFGQIQNGEEGGTNNSDPFIIQLVDSFVEDMSGTDPKFTLIINYNYGGGSSAADTINFTIDGPWTPEAYTEYFYPWGTGGLYLLNDAGWSYYFATFAQFGIDTLDSVYIDTVYIYGYNDGSSNKTLYFYIWDTDPVNFTPRNILYQNSVSLASGANGWQRFYVGKWMPGYFWYGQNSSVSSWQGTGLHPVWWGGALIGQNYTLASSSATDWSSSNIVGSVRLPISGYAEITHHHPQISYYRPKNWAWPIAVSNNPNDQGNTDVVYGDTTVYLSGWVALERTDSTAYIKAGDTMYNYLFLDNYGRGAVYLAGPDSLPGWSYTYYTDFADTIPSGRHTLYVGLDWDHVISSNIYNDYLRYWGQPYTFRPLWKMQPNVLYKSREMAPELFGVSGGYNHQADIYRVRVLPTDSTEWYVVAMRNFNYGNSGDSIDLDLRLYTDEPTSATTGFTHAVEASMHGPDTIEVIGVSSRAVGTSSNMWFGVNSFGAVRDSYYIQLAGAQYLLEYQSGGATQRITMNTNDNIHVEEIYPADPRSTMTFTVTPVSSTQDIAVYLLGKNLDQVTDPYKTLDEAYASADAKGAGEAETITFDPQGVEDTFALVIVNKNPTASKATFDVDIDNIGNALKIRDNQRPGITRPLLLVQNPARGNAALTFAIPEKGKVTVNLFDLSGRRVKTIFNGMAEAGYHTYRLRNLRAGIYFATMKANNTNLVRKFIVIE